MFDFIKIGKLRIAVNKLDYYGLLKNTHPDDSTFTQQVLVVAVAGREPLEIIVSQDAKLEDFLTDDENLFGNEKKSASASKNIACPHCHSLNTNRETGHEIAVDGHTLPCWLCGVCARRFGDCQPI